MYGSRIDGASESSSDRKLSKYYGGYGFVEAQVLERGVDRQVVAR